MSLQKSLQNFFYKFCLLWDFSASGSVSRGNAGWWAGTGRNAWYKSIPLRLAILIVVAYQLYRMNQSYWLNYHTIVDVESRDGIVQMPSLSICFPPWLVMLSHSNENIWHSQPNEAEARNFTAAGNSTTPEISPDLEQVKKIFLRVCAPQLNSLLRGYDIAIRLQRVDECFHQKVLADENLTGKDLAQILSPDSLLANSWILHVFTVFVNASDPLYLSPLKLISYRHMCLSYLHRFQLPRASPKGGADVPLPYRLDDNYLTLIFNMDIFRLTIPREFEPLYPTAVKTLIGVNESEVRMIFIPHKVVQVTIYSPLRFPWSRAGDIRHEEPLVPAYRSTVAYHFREVRLNHFKSCSDYDGTDSDRTPTGHPTRHYKSYDHCVSSRLLAAALDHYGCIPVRILHSLEPINFVWQDFMSWAGELKFCPLKITQPTNTTRFKRAGKSFWADYIFYTLDCPQDCTSYLYTFEYSRDPIAILEGDEWSNDLKRRETMMEFKHGHIPSLSINFTIQMPVDQLFCNLFTILSMWYGLSMMDIFSAAGRLVSRCWERSAVGGWWQRQKFGPYRGKMAAGGNFKGMGNNIGAQSPLFRCYSLGQEYGKKNYGAGAEKLPHVASDLGLGSNGSYAPKNAAVLSQSLTLNVLQQKVTYVPPPHAKAWQRLADYRK